MGKLENHDDAIWDRFFEFVFSNGETENEGDVDAQLRKAGIDVSKAMTQVRNVLQQAKARENLEHARLVRPGLVERLREIRLRPFADLKAGLNEVIRDRLPSTIQATYFRKLEGIASEEDLRSLLEDLERLQEFDSGAANAPE